MNAPFKEKDTGLRYCGECGDHAGDCRLHDAASELLDACIAAFEAAKQEWLYQTGQTVRPAQEYPPQGTVCGELGDVIPILQAAIKKARE